MTSVATIELDSLEVRLGNRAILNGLRGSLEGKAIGLLGPNGSGKSTLINTLLGFHTPSRGTARVFGMDIRRDSRPIRSAVGYMPENDAFIANMSGIAFVRYMAELAGLPPEQAMERAHEAFFYVGLGEARYRKIGTYSLGMKQLAKLAQAIAHGPKLLILDEPTNGLDPLARSRMIQLVREIRDAGETSLFISSHLLRDVDETCDEVLILKNGAVAGICNLEQERRTNRKFLELETVGAGPEFVTAMHALGCECATFPSGRLKIVMPDLIEIRDLYTVAARQGVQIRRMNHRRDSLEDIFLNAMETHAVGATNGRA
jgi:ABC-2 type transport system ATP-binding protein